MKIAILDDYQDVVRTLDCFGQLQGHDVTVWNDHTGDVDILAQRLQDTEALVLIRERTPIRAPLIARLPKLKLISHHSVYPHIDVDALTAQGVLLCSNLHPGQPSYATAELTWGLIIAAMRRIPQEAAALKAGRWQSTVGDGLRGKTLGVYGYGLIGAVIAGYGKAFGMKVLVWAREASLARARADGCAAARSKEAFFEDSDVISLHLRLIDATRGSLRTSDMQNRRLGRGKTFTDADNLWGDGTTGDRASAGVDGHFGAEATWDYYLAVHGRNGIFDDGVGPLSRIHYSRRYNNAYWSDSCRCMTYGDGDGVTFSPLVSLDVAGHEMTHGVTSSTADLVYSGESGGLNEAMSDIFGTMVEFYAAANGATKTPNYLIGEDVFTPSNPNDALRYMDDPTQDGNSIDTYDDYVNGLDVHYSSGIANNAFYLLAEGGTHRLGGVVTGIGRSAAERIFYLALTGYMIPSETFAQARADTLQAATELFGAGSPEVTSVGQAWSAVGVQ